MQQLNNTLKLKFLGIDTYKDPVIFMRTDCHVCRSEGFEVHARVSIHLNNKSILATVYTVSNGILAHDQASLSTYAWELLNASEGDIIHLSHPKPLQSLSFVRSKIYGETLSQTAIQHIMEDITLGRYSDIDIASFLTACAGGRLNQDEIIALTRSMVEVGEKLTWPSEIVVDKHCVGGLPGNRTTLIVVPIVTAFGMIMPKTSSRAITSPAGTADTMETLTNVELDMNAMQAVVQQEGGCIVWGGSVDLSPADDILIRVERAMDLDSEGQLIASVLSKKIAAGSTHILIDIPVGPTAKVRSLKAADILAKSLHDIANGMGLHLKIIITDGIQPVGNGIGPALEAKDVLAVLQNKQQQSYELRERAIKIAGGIIEFSPNVVLGEGEKIAREILDSGKAWQKFQAICHAQGGLYEPPTAEFTYTITAKGKGKVIEVNNRQLARVAKLAGAPNDKAAGIYLHAPLETLVEKEQPLYTIHAESHGELKYAMSLVEELPDIVQMEIYE